MRVEVDFQDKTLELELPDEQCVAVWRGPAGHTHAASPEIVRAALEAPRDYPPLRQTVVPGDRVTIALDPAISEPGVVLGAIAEILREAGVDGENLTVLLPSASTFPFEGTLPPGAVAVAHDPSDRSQLAYLAATKEGRRIYLNRHLTDADVVLPVGQVGFDPILGYSGPWGVIFPGLSDLEALSTHRGRFRVDDDSHHQEKHNRANRDESIEVGWLLGTQLHVGVVPAIRGIVEILAGRDSSVCEQGIASLEQHWTFRPESRAEIVVAGVGRPGTLPLLDSLAEGLATATRLVQHGGKIIMLSNATGQVGPALRCLIDAGDAERGKSLLRGHEKDEDFHVAGRIAQAVAWADVFLYSALPRELVEELSMIPIEKPEQARRLVAQGRSATFLSFADRTRAAVQDEK
jgi:Lactate racemase N-terminal domain